MIEKMAAAVAAMILWGSDTLWLATSGWAISLRAHILHVGPLSHLDPCFVVQHFMSSCKCAGRCSVHASHCLWRVWPSRLSRPSLPVHSAQARHPLAGQAVGRQLERRAAELLERREARREQRRKKIMKAPKLRLGVKI